MIRWLLIIVALPELVMGVLIGMLSASDIQFTLGAVLVGFGMTHLALAAMLQRMGGVR
ncbi:hypothetical protein [Paracoccus suum]|uniref:hypothetical protein n=1 Tax=Paracoccus suum TaxID=2259340 RepID=UPI0013B050FA|nr:hypothetical protein [Paracoccus suum]